MSERSQFGTVERIHGKPGHYVRFSYRGQRLRRYGGPTRKEAHRKRAAVQLLASQSRPLHELLAVFGNDKATDHLRFCDAADRYLESCEGVAKASTLRGDRNRLALVKASAPWAKWPLSDIAPKHVTRWLEDRRTGGAAPVREKGRGAKAGKASVATLNRYLAIVSCVFKWAIARAYVSANPCRSVQRYSEKGRARDLMLDAKHVDAILDAAPEGFRPFLAILTATGMRCGEALALTWADVRLDAGEIRIPAEITKTRTARTIPLLSEAIDAFRSLPGTRFGKAKVFHPLDYHKVRKLWLATLEGAVLPEDVAAIVVLHSLRHCFASRLASSGASMRIIADLMGHSVMSTTARYAHLAPSAKRLAVQALEAGRTARGM